MLGRGEGPPDGRDQLLVHDRGAYPVPGGDDPAVVEGDVDAPDVRIGGQESRHQPRMDGRTEMGTVSSTVMSGTTFSRGAEGPPQDAPDYSRFEGTPAINGAPVGVPAS